MSAVKLTRVRPGLYRHEAGYQVERRTTGFDQTGWYVILPGETHPVPGWHDTLDEARFAVGQHLAAELRRVTSATLTAAELVEAIASGQVPAAATGVRYRDRDWVEPVSVVEAEVADGTWQDANDDDGQTFGWSTDGRNDWWPGTSLADAMAEASRSWPASQAPF